MTLYYFVNESEREFYDHAEKIEKESTSDAELHDKLTKLRDYIDKKRGWDLSTLDAKGCRRDVEFQLACLGVHKIWANDGVLLGYINQLKELGIEFHAVSPEIVEEWGFDWNPAPMDEYYVDENRDEDRMDFTFKPSSVLAIGLSFAIEKKLEYLQNHMKILQDLPPSGPNPPRISMPNELNEEVPPNHITMDRNKAERLFAALTADDVKWLAEEIDKETFVNKLTLPPTGEKIRFKQLNQIRYVVKNVLFNGVNRVEDWGLIMQLFDAENGNIKNVKKASKNPEKHDIFDRYMGN